MKKTLEQKVKDVQYAADTEIERIKREAAAKAKRLEEQAQRWATRDKEVGELKAKLEEEHGVQNNPKRDLLWSKAWELGHSAGLNDVDTYYSDLVDLIK